MKQTTANHPTHVMKKASSTIEAVLISTFRLRPNQKRRLTKYVCVCDEEDVFYHQADHPEMMVEEYTKPAKK